MLKGVTHHLAPPVFWGVEEGVLFTTRKSLPSFLPLFTRARAMNNAWKGIFLRVVLASRGETGGGGGCRKTPLLTSFPGGKCT